MGLDQYIFKNEKGRDEVESQHNKLEKEAEDYAYNLADTYEVKDIINNFVKDNSKYLRNPEDAIDGTRHKVATILYGLDEVEHTKWNLFNNCTDFSFDLNDREKYKIAERLVNDLKDFKPTKEQSNRVKKIDKLDKQLDCMQTEVAYWRKYHDLNNYILDKFGGDNCEDTILSKGDMEDILEFIKTDEGLSRQVVDILNDWDDEATYVYHPWW